MELYLKVEETIIPVSIILPLPTFLTSDQFGMWALLPVLGVNSIMSHVMARLAMDSSQCLLNLRHHR